MVQRDFVQSCEHVHVQAQAGESCLLDLLVFRLLKGSHIHIAPDICGLLLISRDLGRIL
jgi:hypothetical protein